MDYADKTRSHRLHLACVAARQLGPIFKDDKYLEGLLSQISSLKQRVRLIFYGSTLVAFITIGGGIPSSENIEAFNIRMPASLLTQQALAIILAAMFTSYCQSMISLLIGISALQIILRAPVPSTWPFLVAHRDADLLWATLLHPKDIGYATPKFERIMVRVLTSGHLFIQIVYIGIVIMAASSATVAAWASHRFLAETLGVVALLGIAISTISLIGAIAIPMPYRWSALGDLTNTSE